MQRRPRALRGDVNEAPRDGRTPAPLAQLELGRALAVLAPLRAVGQPLFVGLDRIPERRPLLFVGNHTVWGLFDVPFLFAELHQKKGIFLRALGDHLHFRIPICEPWSTRRRPPG